MNWNNVDLDSSEVFNYLIDGLTFDTLLLEIECNLVEITPATVTAQFELDLKSRINEAKSVFLANRDNIVQTAIKYREDI